MAKNKHGFTLIELLIVIAIIAILALIAIPNFLEAQTRSKVARASADMRTIAIAYNAYHVDWNTVPPDVNDPTDFYTNPANSGYGWMDENPNLLPDITPFTGGTDWHTVGIRVYYHYCFNKPLTTPVAYITTVPRDPFSKFMPYAYDTYQWNPVTYCQRASVGPDRVAGQWLRRADTNNPLDLAIPYDPSNGTISAGDIYRPMVVNNPSKYRDHYPFNLN